MAKKLQATIQTKSYAVPVKQESELKPTPSPAMGGNTVKQIKGKRGGHPAGMMIRGSGC